MLVEIEKILNVLQGIREEIRQLGERIDKLEEATLVAVASPAKRYIVWLRKTPSNPNFNRLQAIKEVRLVAKLPLCAAKIIVDQLGKGKPYKIQIVNTKSLAEEIVQELIEAKFDAYYQAAIPCGEN